MTKIAAKRAALALQEFLVAEGNKGFGFYGRQVKGWVQPNYMNSLEYGLKPTEDGKLTWFVEVDGEGHVAFEPDPFDEDEHRPVDAEKGILPLLRRGFGHLGLDVASVRLTGWTPEGGETHLRFDVVTAMPDWLEDYDPKNRDRLEHNGTLVTLRFDKAIPVDGRMPGYLMKDGSVRIPREVVDRLLVSKSYDGRNHFSGGIAKDGSLSMTDERSDKRVFSAVEVVVDLWGNIVPTWEMRSDAVSVDMRFDVDMPYEVGGLNFQGMGFEEIDAQYGQAPWSEPAVAPRP